MFAASSISTMTFIAAWLILVAAVDSTKLGAWLSEPCTARHCWHWTWLLIKLCSVDPLMPAGPAIVTDTTTTSVSGVRIWLGTAHVATHLFSAASVAVWIDTAFAFLAAHGNLKGGMHLQRDVFNASFSSAALAIEYAGSLTFGFVPAFLDSTMLMADSMQTQHVLRQHTCSNRAMLHAELPAEDLQNFYYLRVICWLLRASWYWVLSCPLVATIFACYLWIAVTYLGMHWNEGFSSLQHTGFKNFVRFRVRRGGDLEVFAIGIDRCPTRWVLDSDHQLEAAAQKANESGGAQAKALHEWQHPSRWTERSQRKWWRKKQVAKIVDHFIVKK
jgi:hypothetical protein